MLDLADIIEKRYQQAVVFLLWFEPAWEGLTEENRYLLTEFFLREEKCPTETLQRVSSYLGFEKTAVYKRRDLALKKLELLLFGK